MGCPVHIWAPLMTGMVPLARMARDRLSIRRADRAAETAPKRTIQRFAPITPGGVSADASKAASPEA
ncbi:MAG: hypothetical protein R3C39_01350 [Dehalococcoidia bacterium]